MIGLRRPAPLPQKRKRAEGSCTMLLFTKCYSVTQGYYPRQQDWDIYTTVRTAAISVMSSCPPLLFSINGEFMHITTMTLQSRFLSQLDYLSEGLLKVFAMRSGEQGRKIKDVTAMMTDDIDVRRESLIKGLCFYLNENPDILVQEYMDMTEATALTAIEKTTVGIYVSRDMPGCPDLGVIIEGVVVLQDLDSVALAVAMLFGLFYSLNMSYPSQLPYTFEVIQKVIMELDATQLSRKAQNLKTKLLM